MKCFHELDSVSGRVERCENFRERERGTEDRGKREERRTSSGWGSREEKGESAARGGNLILQPR